MNQEKQFLVSGAELKCPYGTITCKLKAGKNYAMMQIGNRIFPPVQAAKKEENIEGFGMCLSPKCIGGTLPCKIRMLPANKWINPITLNSVLLLQGGEEAIHRNAKLLCVSGQSFIQVVTTGQDELTESEKKFYQYMSEMFGFDDDVIAIMLKVIYAIDEAYPNESERQKAWRFARLMGGFSYGFGEENKFIEIRNGLGVSQPSPVDYDKISDDIYRWNITAGFYGDINNKVNEKDYFVDKLHLSEEEYYKLRFHVMAQHEITSRPVSCFPQYMTDKITDGNPEHEFTHPYSEVWKDYFAKFDVKENFPEEWERLYNKYVKISNNAKKELQNQCMLFSDYANIESNVKKHFRDLEKKAFVPIDYSIEPNYSDFSHQQILTATITLEDAVADKMVGDYTEYFAEIIGRNMQYYGEDFAPWLGEQTSDVVHSYRTSLAGWLGDLWLADGKMSEDDYKADLDGVNISNLIIKEDINTIEAMNEYYGELDEFVLFRERDFLRNMGNGKALTGYINVQIKSTTTGIPLSAINVVKQLWNIVKGGEASEYGGNESAEEFMKRIKVGVELD